MGLLQLDFDCFTVGWLLNVQWQTFHVYFEREQVLTHCGPYKSAPPIPHMGITLGPALETPPAPSLNLKNLKNLIIINQKKKKNTSKPLSLNKYSINGQNKAYTS